MGPGAAVGPGAEAAPGAEEAGVDSRSSFTAVFLLSASVLTLVAAAPRPDAPWPAFAFWSTTMADAESFSSLIGTSSALTVAGGADTPDEADSVLTAPRLPAFLSMRTATARSAAEPASRSI